MERFRDLTDAFDALVFPDAIPLEAGDLRSLLMSTKAESVVNLT